MPINVIDILKPANNGQFPAFEDIDGYGGFQVRQDLTDRDSIPAANRKVGMMVYVISDSTFYQLNASNAWVKASFTSNLSGSTIDNLSINNAYIGNSYVDGYTRSNTNLSFYTQPDANIFAHYKFEGAGTAAYKNYGVTSGLDLSITTASSSYNNIWPNYNGGLFGGSLYSTVPNAWSNGQGAVLKTSDSPSNPGSEITVSCWVYLREYHGNYNASDIAITGGYWNTFIQRKYNNSSSWDTDLNSPGASFELATDVYPNGSNKKGAWYARVAVKAPSDPNPTIQLITSNSDGKRIPLNTWCLLAMTYSQSDGKLRCYFNGDLAGELSIAGNKPIAYSNGAYFIGYNNVSNGAGFYPFKPMPGIIDDVRIESVVRTQPEIKAIYDKAAPLVNNVISKELISEIKDQSAYYPNNLRTYQESTGNTIFVKNAYWNDATGKWVQENKSKPSSLINLSTAVESNSNYNDYRYERNMVIVNSKNSNSDDWQNVDWNAHTFRLDSGTANKTDGTAFNYSSLYLGPLTGNGYAHITLLGNQSTSTSTTTSGPFIQINKSYPIADAVSPNALYSANIPKATASFYGQRIYNTLNLSSNYDANVLTSFNIESVEYSSTQFANINQDNQFVSLPPTNQTQLVFKVHIKTAISNMVPTISCYSNIFPIDSNGDPTYNPSLNDIKPIILRDKNSPESILWIVFIGNAGYTSAPLTVGWADYSGYGLVREYRTPTFNLVIFGEQ